MYVLTKASKVGGQGWAVTPKYKTWEGKRMFSPLPPSIIVIKIYNCSILNFNPTSSPIFKWINEM